MEYKRALPESLKSTLKCKRETEVAFFETPVSEPLASPEGNRSRVANMAWILNKAPEPAISVSGETRRLKSREGELNQTSSKREENGACIGVTPCTRGTLKHRETT